MKISRLTIGLGLAAVVGLFGLVEANASPFSMFFLADDLGNQVHGTAPEASEWDSEGGDPDRDNNGHGNNEDGVDSSNPGDSKTDQDTKCDADGNCVDDEMGSGKSGTKK
jgi:hypothetical protein